MTASEKGIPSWRRNSNFIGNAEFLPAMDLRPSMYLTIHLSRLETESQNQTHQTQLDDGGNGRTERPFFYLQRWLRKNQGFFQSGGGRRRM